MTFSSVFLSPMCLTQKTYAADCYPHRIRRIKKNICVGQKFIFAMLMPQNFFVTEKLPLFKNTSVYSYMYASVDKYIETYIVNHNHLIN